MGEATPAERIRSGLKVGLSSVQDLTERARRPGGKLPSRRTRRRALLWGILAGVLALLVVLGADAVLSSRHALAQIKLARDDLINGSTSVVSGDPHGSVPAFTEALASANAAAAAANHPGLRLMDALPIIGGNVDAVKAVAHAEAASAEAGLVMAQAAEQLNWETFAMPAVRNLGHVDLPAIREASPKIHQVAVLLHDAFRELQAADSAHLVGPVATGYQETLDTLSRRASLAADADNLFHLLPPLLGGGREHRYLVVVGSLAQPYGPSGRIGPLGVLTANQGTLRLTPLAPADTTIADAAASPDFPEDAQAMLAAAKTEGQGSLDGVIMVDTQGLQDLLWMVGDVRTASWPTTLSWANAGDTLDGEIFSGSSAATADAQQAAITNDVMNGVLKRHPSTEAFGTAMAKAVGGRHFMIYSTNPLAQGLLGRLGASGRLVHLDNPLAVVWNTVGAPRTGALTQRSITVGVSLDLHGNAVMHTNLDLENHAPDTPPSVLLGPAESIDPVGSYTAEASVYLPPGAANVTVETSSPSTTTVTNDGVLPVATGRVTAISGGAMSMLVSAHVDGAARRAGTGWTYRIRIVPQAAANVDPVRLRILIPPTLTVASTSDGMQVAGNKITYTGTTARPTVLFVSYH
jgi:hypothetical protein